MIGRRFSLLTVVERAGSVNRRAMWRCRCACGGEAITAGKELRNGHTRSCGCRRDAAMGWHDLHGGTGTRLYEIWKGMHKRCRKPIGRSECYADVAVCAEWSAFPPFRDWALANGYSDDLTIDRWPNPAGGYEPGNCRWATALEQRHNRR